MEYSPRTSEAYQLFHQGVEALCQIESNGIYIDRSYYEAQEQELYDRISPVETRLMAYPEIQLWKRIYREKFSLESNPQLSTLLYDKMGLKTDTKTATGKDSVNQETLTAFHLPFLDDLLLFKKYSKTLGTYVQGFLKETGPDNFLHPFFNLHTAQTFRSSSSCPNWQNIPARDAEIKKLVRSGIKPRSKDRHIVEIDYSGIEVKVAACYHKDPTMLKYIHDPTTDMHRDMAMQCYKLGQSEWTKKTRYCAKNKFVFPQFYGDYWKACARNLWNDIEIMKLVTSDGVPLQKHLQSHGIKTLKQFEKHIKEVEQDFWYSRFPVYQKWKDAHVSRYTQNGFFDLLTGFRCQGVMRRNEAINYPVQGAAFHCLLWSLINVNKILTQRMDSCIIGQIHDSLILDVPTKELSKVLSMCKRIMCEDLKKNWPWIIVPLGIEIEVAPAGESWYEKTEVMEFSCGNKDSVWTWNKKTDRGNVRTCPVCGLEEVQVAIAA